MQIAFFEVKGWEEKYLKKGLKSNLLKFSEEKLSMEKVQQIKNYDAISVFIY